MVRLWRNSKRASSQNYQHLVAIQARLSLLAAKYDRFSQEEMTTDMRAASHGFQVAIAFNIQPANASQQKSFMPYIAGLSVALEFQADQSACRAVQQAPNGNPNIESPRGRSTGAASPLDACDGPAALMYSSSSSVAGILIFIISFAAKVGTLRRRGDQRSRVNDSLHGFAAIEKCQFKHDYPNHVSNEGHSLNKALMSCDKDDNGLQS
jgi:hypothetical protein